MKWSLQQGQNVFSHEKDGWFYLCSECSEATVNELMEQEFLVMVETFLELQYILDRCTHGVWVNQLSIFWSRAVQIAVLDI